MADRRTAERLIVPPESLQRVSMCETADPVGEPPEEPTQPMRLSFLALLAASSAPTPRAVRECHTCLPACAATSEMISESIPCHIVLPNRDSDPSHTAPPTCGMTMCRSAKLRPL